MLGLFRIGVILFAAVSESILILYWARSFSKMAKDSWKYDALIIVLTSLWILISLVFFKNPLILILFTAIACLTLFKREKVPGKVSVIATLIFCTLTALCDVLATITIILFNGETIENIRFIPQNALIANVISKFLLLLCVSLVYNKKRKILPSLLSTKSIYLLVLPITSIFILYQMLEFSGTDNPIRVTLCLIGVVGLFIGNIYSFTFFEKEKLIQEQLEKERCIKNQLNAQRVYYKNLMDANSKVRSMRHDLKNSYIALLGYIRSGNIEAASQFLCTQIDELDQIPPQTGHPALDALLESKKREAREKAIQMILRINLPEKLGIDEIDLCIILGNSLDNALEACKAMPKGEGRIGLDLRMYRRTLYLEVKNTTNEEPVESKGRWKTTKEDSENHGIGLQSIAGFVEKYDGVMEIKVVDRCFVLTVNLNSGTQWVNLMS